MCVLAQSIKLDSRKIPLKKKKSTYPASSWINSNKYNNIQKELSKLKMKFNLPFLSMNYTVNICSSLLLNWSFEILHF